ncbi:exported hypothetical protein [Nitrospina gracilis 3/211]|uniref:Uncharacterized protein n=1 Tax=Nitrospina gracilis (strain 3/211) TaxID=1266370 RepID=M1Z145_NITG3|nr:exported hypothetical protein [Nitrospina gracilis 3/211]
MIQGRLLLYLIWAIAVLFPHGSIFYPAWAGILPNVLAPLVHFKTLIFNVLRV